MSPQILDSFYDDEGSRSSTDTGSSSPSNERRRGHAEDIAIVGMACRLPGDVTSGDKMWDLLTEGRSGQCDIPTSRFNADAFYSKQGLDRPGSMNTKGGYFLKEDIREFENDFFGINNLEATYMDPQQRKLLEVVFECFESAGIPLDKVSGSNTGCYVGNFTVDFQTMQTRDAEYLHRYSATGMGTTILGNRISHAFNLTGPSLVLDTACSSSLYCLHVACAALENGECESAIVAGANLIQSPEQHLGTLKAGVLSGTSTCHTFDASADGYGRADGIGALYLKTLSDAIRDGDPIRSVIRGTAINANGKTPGITLPSAIGQEAVIRKAYAKAGLPVTGTPYVECHGTGTPVGDPIEVEAVSRVFKRPSTDPVLVGSIKSNLGHSEAASGIASIIKVTLALEHSYIPATIGVTRINPKIKTAEWNVAIATDPRAWPGDQSGGQNSVVRRAGVNSFGYGGANAHAILESADFHVPSSYGGSGRARALLDPRKTFLLPFSAASTKSLDARITDLAEYDFKDASITDLAYTLGSRRQHFNQRGFVVVKGDTFRSDLCLDNLRTLPNTVFDSPSRYAFVFTGQGAQWAQMGKELFDEFPVFRQSISEQDSILRSLPHPPQWTLRDALLAPEHESKINEVTHSQPTCTALQIALVQLLASWDIFPSTVLGHSSGEIAAAFAAGHIALAEAITAAYYRGYVVGKDLKLGAMMAAGFSRKKADSEIKNAGLQEKIRVACVNSAESVTISGDVDAIDKLLETLQASGVFARKLKTGGRAYHSHHMLAVGHEYQTLLDQAFRKLDLSSKLPTGAQFISSVTGEPLTSGFDSAYWRSNLENPVLFADVVGQLSKEGQFHLIELGPHSALEMPIKQTRSNLGVSEDTMPYSAALTRGKNSVDCILSLAGRLFLHGNAVSMAKINNLNISSKSGLQNHQYKVLHGLPAYRWNYDNILWSEGRASLEFRHRKHRRHELLGSKVPGGNGLESTWRNVLRVDEVNWLQDHKLEQTVVFPGAGYVAMAVEAVAQESEQPLVPGETSLHLENVNVLSALALSTESTAQVELFTTLRPTPITYTSGSKNWWDFNIASFQGGIPTNHATGSIMVKGISGAIQAKFQPLDGTLEPSATRIWYEKLIKEGLNFGKAFQSITNVYIPRMKSVRHCTTEVPLLQRSDEDDEAGDSYVVHPITIDAMLQTAIIATTAGNTQELKAKVPTKIGSAVIEVPKILPSDKWSINANASVIGFGAAQNGAELFNQDGQIILQLENVRLAPYEAAAQVEAIEKRHPMLRTLWKPDLYGLGLMDIEDLTRYLDDFVAEAHSDIADEGLLKMGAALNLISHKNPRLRILELGNDVSELTQAALGLLLADNAFKRLYSYTTASISDDDELLGLPVNLQTGKPNESTKVSPISGEEYDLVLLPNKGQADTYLQSRLESIQNLLAPGGIVLALSALTGNPSLSSSTLETVISDLKSGEGCVVLAHRPQESETATIAKKNIVVVHQNANRLSDKLAKLIPEIFGKPAQQLTFSDVTNETVPPGTVVISLLEAEKPLLSRTSNAEMSCVKIITDNASTIVWVTGGNLLNGQNPNFALVSGLSRALMLEQPSLKFLTFDIDDVYRPPTRSASNILSALKQSTSGLIDFEFIERQGVAHVSRFVPDDDLNDTFRQKQGAETMTATLESAEPAQISIETPGQFDSIYFKKIQLPDSLKPSEVQVDVKAVGLNAKDFYVLGGKVDTKDASCTLEYCGVVERIGSHVTSMAPGDRVVVMAPGYFKTSEIVPEWACEKLRPEEDFNTLSTLPVVYATALYALHNRAQIQPGESVLIHSGAGGVGIAAIQIAQMAGAEVFTTVSTEDKKEHLVKTFGIKPSNVFSSRDTSFLSGIQEATNGEGVDVVLNSLTGDLLHASWRCLASFGRFVEIGKRDLTDSGRLEMDQFLKNTSYSAFDMSNMYYHENPAYHQLWSELLNEVLDLYRHKKIAKIEPLEVFDVSNMTSALRYFSSRNRMGKVAINLEDPTSSLDVQPFKFKTTFSPEKSYVMIGCLGGLGRSMTKWMVARGARKFVFLGRSGIDKGPARRLVEDLESKGAECRVVRGDVCSQDDCQKVVDQVDGSIGGVVQAAMGLNEALFTTMSNEYWHTGIDPKVIGTWNLHNAIKGKDSELDFFLMTSSISGSVGTATESNYCSANYFLDMFARYRQSLGLPGMSVGLGMISEVGYLHENPEIEALLLRKGIQAINEDELIQIIDITLSNGLTIPHAYDSYARAHVLTGLEPFGLMELRKKGFEGTSPTLGDPRASILASALDGRGDLAGDGQDGNLPVEVAKAMEEGSPLPEAVLAHISKRFGDLVLIPFEKVDVKKPLATYGMDSMIAAEFRAWFFKAFKVDIPFLELLSKTVTLIALSISVLAEVNSTE